jgi:tetratricopeptide (TPR) repeat protein
MLRRFDLLEGELRSTTAGLAYAYRLQALILHARQDPKEREALLRVQALMPHFPGLESALGHEDLLRSRFERAKAEFSQARSINPDLDMMVGEAILAVRSGDLREAEVTLSEVANRSRARLLIAFREWPASVKLPVDLKRRLLKDLKLEQVGVTLPAARELYQEQRWESLVQVLASKNLNPEESFWLGCSLARIGRFDEAIPPLERARRETKLALEANYWLSLCYARGAEEGNPATPENREGKQPCASGAGGGSASSGQGRSCRRCRVSKSGEHAPRRSVCLDRARSLAVAGR